MPRGKTRVRKDAAPAASDLPLSAPSEVGSAVPEASPTMPLAKRGVQEVELVRNKVTGSMELLFGEDCIILHAATFTDVEAGCTGGLTSRISCTPEAPDGSPLYDSMEKGSIEVGLLTPDQHEFFLTLPSLGGTLKMVKLDGMWFANLAKDAPEVLKAGAPLPPEGCSALPASLEAHVPAPGRYWEKSGDDAARAHAWLLETGYLSHDGVEIRRVAGEVRLVVVERSYFMHQPEGVEKSSAWMRTIAGLLPEGARVASPFAEDDWQSAIKSADGAILVLDPPSTADLSPRSLVELAAGHECLLAYDDTPEARAQFTKAGRVFKLRDPAVADKIFVASFRVVSKEVAWLPRSPRTETAQKAAFERVSKCLNQVRVLRAKDTEERFVYGIAMEPDEVDSQGDTQTAETIRTAAHKFMEDYGNVGLQHQKFINDRVKILESAIMPFGGTFEGQTIKAGTWVFGVRVNDDAIWKGCQDGSITGFSIGGTAVRDPI